MQPVTKYKYEMHKKDIQITIDHREKPSGVHLKLSELCIPFEFKTLKAGDYIINDQIIIERKTKDDFALSIVQGRLFKQCAKLKKSSMHQIILIEGNPYLTQHKIEREAIQGALISIGVSWQIPILFSADIHSTALTLQTTVLQNLKEKSYQQRYGYKPKTPLKQAHYFLQGLPKVGPKLSILLLKKFGSLENIINANEQDLMEIEGLGYAKAANIRQFLCRQFNSG